MPSSRGLSRENERPRQTISKRKSVCRGFLYFFKKFFQCAKTLHIDLIPFSHQRKGGETGESKRTPNAAYRRAVRTQIRHNRQSGVRTRRVAQNDLLRHRGTLSVLSDFHGEGYGRRRTSANIWATTATRPCFRSVNRRATAVAE